MLHIFIRQGLAFKDTCIKGPMEQILPPIRAHYNRVPTIDTLDSTHRKIRQLRSHVHANATGGSDKRSNVIYRDVHGGRLGIHL